jgi:hypothetical protein
MKFTWIPIILIFSISLSVKGNSVMKHDSLDVKMEKKDPALFYDSLEVKASRHRVTDLIYDLLITTPKVKVDKDLLSYEYFKGFENKKIGSIKIKSLEVFGPSLTDTAKTTNVWIEKTANKLHTKSNLSVIQKNLWIKEGQNLDPELLMDNERLLRSLPYLQDVRIILTPEVTNTDVVDVLVLTKDVFSFGASASLSGLKSGSIGIYDQNIFGRGHEIGVKIVGSTVKYPNVGFDTYYRVNNLGGNFINLSAGYMNTYLREGLFISADRDFLRPQSVYAGGLTALRNFRSTRINSNDLVLTEFPLNYLFLDGWYGRRLKRSILPNDSRFQINISGRIRYTSFYERPEPDAQNKQYYANSTFYLGGVSFSHRSYVRDLLVYSYGITEDVPKGYLHELVFGYDHNEFGDRWYSHAFFSSGNLFNKKPFYFYTSFGIGSYWKATGFEQGMIDFKINYISDLFKVWNVQSRQFIKLDYTLGINRFDIENLYLGNVNGIRGFSNKSGVGKQRLTLNFENVFFQRRSILNFQTAIFSFLDLGLLGDSHNIIFNQNFYSGIGVGLRIRNENLVFKTIQIRLAYYPNHPSAVNSFGILVDGVSKTQFYSFQPRGPEPLRFE